ncbi:MAG TPA: FMN-binding protein [Candidatus Saccharimonadales bacterium]|nr:FMN-binding protein [Candidatus Saccharimonadales bacterium]
MNVKKAIVGLGILGVFAIYSLGIRHENPTIAKPSSLSTGNTSPGSSTSTPTSTSSGGGTPPSHMSGNSSSAFKDGTYTGSVADAYYGNVQVQTTISGGKITAVKFLQYPDTHSTSVYINQQAMPYLQQEAIQAQSANVQIISGATFTSQAFQQSLQSALSQA